MPSKPKSRGGEKSQTFDEWAPKSLHAAFAMPLRTFGAPLRRVLDTREARLMCSQLLSRHRDAARAYRYPGLWENGRRSWVGGDTQEERIVSLVLYALAAPHAPGQTVKQRAEGVATLRAALKANTDMAVRGLLSWESAMPVLSQANLDIKTLEMLPAYERERSDPQIRSAAVLVACEARQLFSGPLFGCVTNLLNAVYGRKVCTARDVKRWWHNESTDQKVGT